MKITKLMLSALIAATALVACNKENHTPEVTGLKTVQVSLENVIMTKAPYEVADKISAGQAIVVNNFKVFLTDANGNLYDAKDVNGTPLNLYYTAVPTEPVEYHFVNPNCTRVVVVANVGDVDMNHALAALNIDDEQNPKDLSLYAAAELTTDGTTVTHDNGEVTVVYKASLKMAPRISRFEIDGFRVTFGSTPKYSNITVSQVGFQHYYPTTSITTGVESGEVVNHIENLQSDVEVFGWFDGTKSASWYWDAINCEITPAAPAAGTAKPLAYHFFSTTMDQNVMPIMLIKLVVDGHASYLYSDHFVKPDGTPVTSMEEGKIYRMHAEGTTSGSDGFVEIPEDVIDPLNRCIQLTVTVENWAVQLVKPIF